MDKLELENVDWHQVLQLLGVPPEWISNPRREGPCPIEQAGKTRFRFTNRKGRGDWFCSHCGAGDGVRLVALLRNCSDTEAIFYLKNQDAPKVSAQVIKLRENQNARDIKDAHKKRVVLQKLWDSGLDVKPGDPVALYLARRISGFNLDWVSLNIRFVSDLFHADEFDHVIGSDGKKKPKISYRPAMVAKVTDAKGWPVTLHRTYLSSDGFKALVSPEQVKKQMSGVAPLTGQCIHINKSKGASNILCITEGIETGFGVVAAYENTHDVWAALNAGNLPKVQVPKTYKGVIIFADKDNLDPRTGWRPGEHFAELLAKRLKEEGFEVQIRTPDKVGTDFADLWNGLWESRQSRLRLVASSR